MTVTEPQTVTSIAAHYLGELSITFDHVQIAATPLGTRITAIVASGQLDGPRVSGKVRVGGGDWLLIGTDGVARVDVRITIVTDDDDMIFMTSTGRAHLVGDARDRYLLGEAVDGRDMFGRTAKVFETGAARLDWLNSTVAIGVVTALAQTHVHYQIFALD